jgi:hypothetical protein
MFRYKKYTDEGFCLFESAKQPFNKEGLIEITEEEYAQLAKELEEVSE